MHELLVFDGDDTLWVVEPIYDEARSSARALIEQAGLDGEQWERLQRIIDVENVERFGLSPTRFPTSCVEAYIQVADSADVSVDRDLQKRIAGKAAAVFHRTAPLVPEALDVLTELSASFRLALLTKGDATVQEKRVADSGLREYFEAISIVSNKDTAAFEALLASVAVAPPDAWSIGNSIPSDISPAVSLGMSAIWIDAHVWEHERREHGVLQGRVIEVTRLSQVPDALRHARSAA